MECPLATIDGQVNLKNHLTTIRIAGLGPPNPNLPNNQFWQAKAVRWEVGVNEARSRLCSNCGHYIFTPKVQECMKQHDNITPDMVGPEWVDTHDSGGWCNLYNITCTAHRTCVDWEPGGPVTTEGETEMEERDDAAMPKTKKAKQAKIAKVMHEFKTGTLKGSDKKAVTNRKQAIAIALSEAGMSMKGKSDAYWDGYIDTMMEGAAMESEEEGKP
jgi:hypothetical protein